MKQAGQLLQGTDYPYPSQRVRDMGEPAAERAAESSLLLSGR
jgi:hypothetical protein